MRAVSLTAILVWVGLTTAGCGSGSSVPEPERTTEAANVPAAQVEPSDPSAELPDLTRALIPEEADAVAEEELAVEECGIAPVFPCVRAYFVIEDLDLRERVALIRQQARSAGWRIVSERRDAGVTIEIAHEPFVGTYMVEGGDPLLCEAASLCLAGTMLTVLGPPTPLPAPSEAEQAAWSAEKREYVRDANAVCKKVLTRLAAQPDAFPETVASASEELAALDPPAGEERQVAQLLRPLANLVRAARALSDDRGEDALPAAVAVAEFAKRFNRAAAGYGLDRCATVG